MTHSLFAGIPLKRFLLIAALGAGLSLSSLSAAHAALSDESAVYLRSNSIVQGANNSGDLMLSKEINRAELMKIVVKTVASVEPTLEENNNCFPDVKKEWFAPYICWAQQQGYVQGYDDGLFHPERSVTEAEALKIINNALSLGVDDFVPSSRPWYEGYYNTAVKKNIVGSDTGTRLANPALRGDVFEQLTRALTVSELQKDTFIKGDTAKILSQNTQSPSTKSLSQEQKDLLSTLESTINYGYQPQSAEGSSIFKLAIASSDVTADFNFNANTTTKVTGTKESLDKAQIDVVLHSDINVSVFGETLNLALDTKGSMLLDAVSGVYMKLDAFTLEDKNSSESLTSTIESTQSEVAQYIGKWYSIPLDEDTQQELTEIVNSSNQKDMIEKSIDMMKNYFAQATDIIKVSRENVQYKEKDGDDFTITVDGATLVKQLPEIISRFSPTPLNKYEVRKDLRQAAPYIEKFFANFSYKLWSDKNTHLIHKSTVSLTPTSFIIPAEVIGSMAASLMLEITGTGDYTYPTAVTIEIPANAEPIPQDTF